MVGIFLKWALTGDTDVDWFNEKLTCPISVIPWPKFLAACSC